jgi:hypothetical protein
MLRDPVGFQDLPAGPPVSTPAAPPATRPAAGAPVIRPTAAAGAPDLEQLPVGKTDLAWEAVAAAALDDDSEIVPWDRRPLMVVIAAGTALIALAILSGVATASMFGTDELPAAWRAPSVGGPPGPAATPSATVAPGAGIAEGEGLTLSGVGDVIMGTMPGDIPPNNGAGFFDPVKSALASDVVMGNLETPFTNDTGKVKCPKATPTPNATTPTPKPTQTDGCHQFYLPPSYASHVKDAGFRVMNLANNHTNDMGPEGLSNTRAALEAVGVLHTGAPNQITYLTVKAVKVAVIGFSVYSWGQNLNNIPAAEQLVRKAAAEADLVIVQMQGGAEGADKTHVKPGKEIYLGEDRGDLMKFSHAVIDAGADAVFGHGPHVMRGMEFYKGRIIAYSLGNFCGYGVLSSTGNLGVGGVLKLTLKKDGTWVGGQLVPTEMIKGGLPAPDAQKRALSIVNGLSKDDFGVAAASISTTDGKITPPPSG